VSRSLTLEALDVDETVLDSLYEGLQREIYFELATQMAGKYL
jgi:hypothetical protein